MMMAAMGKMELPLGLQDAAFEGVLLELVPSWNEKGTQLLPKKIWYVVGVLALCGKPISFGHLLECFQYKKRNTFRENYINPLKRLGFIESTNPETPNSPDNKYVITENGKAFLMGQ